jgi:Tol biopolymer transport system component
MVPVREDDVLGRQLLKPLNGRRWILSRVPEENDGRDDQSKHANGNHCAPSPRRSRRELRSFHGRERRGPAWLRNLYVCPRSVGRHGMEGVREAISELLDGVDVPHRVGPRLKSLAEDRHGIGQARLLDERASWSPNGDRIAYHSSQAGVISPFVMDLKTRTEKRLLQPKEGVAVDDWTRNDTLVLRTYGKAVYALPVTGERKLEPLADTPYGKDQLQVSPNGQWIAFNSDESKAWEVYVARFPEFTDKRRVSVAGGVQPRWRGDGRELFYLAPDGTMMVVRPDRSSAARRLFKTSLNPPSHQISEFDVSSNGQRFLVLEPASTRPQTLTYLLNWIHAR